MSIQDMDHRFLIESKLEESTLNDLWEIYCEINNFWNKEKSIVNNSFMEQVRSEHNNLLANLGFTSICPLSLLLCCKEPVRMLDFGSVNSFSGKQL